VACHTIDERIAAAISYGNLIKSETRAKNAIARHPI
jgi:hypothetical protein